MGLRQTKIYQQCQKCKADLSWKFRFYPISMNEIHTCNECGRIDNPTRGGYFCQNGCNWSICQRCKDKYEFVGYHGLAAPKVANARATRWAPSSMEGQGELGKGVYTSKSISTAKHYARNGGMIFEVYSTRTPSVREVNTAEGSLAWIKQRNGNNNDAVDQDWHCRLSDGLSNKFTYITTQLEPETLIQTKYNPQFYPHLRMKPIL